MTFIPSLSDTTDVDQPIKPVLKYIKKLSETRVEWSRLMLGPFTVPAGRRCWKATMNKYGTLRYVNEPS